MITRLCDFGSSKFIYQKEVSPLTKYVKSMDDLEKHSFNVPSTKQNKLAIMISGLGWISVNGKGQTIKVRVPRGVLVVVRDAMI